jgi:hypothetical protein
MKIDWDNVAAAAWAGAVIVGAGGFALAVLIATVSAAVSYAGCQFNPTSNRCVVMAAADRAHLCKTLGGKRFCE